MNTVDDCLLSGLAMAVERADRDVDVGDPIGHLQSGVRTNPFETVVELREVPPLADEGLDQRVFDRQFSPALRHEAVNSAILGFVRELQLPVRPELVIVGAQKRTDDVVFASVTCGHLQAAWPRSVLLVPRRERVVAVAVRVANLPVPAVDHQLGVLADRPRAPGVDLDMIEAALLLATARRLCRPRDRPPLAPVRSLAYYMPVLEELLAQRLPPGYLNYLRSKVQLPPTS